MHERDSSFHIKALRGFTGSVRALALLFFQSVADIGRRHAGLRKRGRLPQAEAAAG